MIQLEPVFELGKAIRLQSSSKTFRLGKAEVEKSLRVKVLKVSKGHLQFKPHYDTQTVTVTGNTHTGRLANYN